MTRALTTAQLRARAQKLAKRLDCFLMASKVPINGKWIVIGWGTSRGGTPHEAWMAAVARLERALRARVRADQKALG